MTLSENLLVKAGRRGLLVGPCEEADAFQTRCTLPSVGAFPQIDLFQITPDWVEVSYQNKGLRFWEGGASWIEGAMVKIQLKKRAKGRGKLWGIYGEEELIAHEGVHAARVMFSEKVFEELLAYQTSKSAFRKFFGPLFRSPKESYFFFVTTLFAPFHPLLLLFFVAISIYGVARLIRVQRKFKKALLHLSAFVGSRALALSLRLTDREIFFFAKAASTEALRYIEEQKCLRWQQIKSEFFSALYCQCPAPFDI